VTARYGAFVCKRVSSVAAGVRVSNVNSEDPSGGVQAIASALWSDDVGRAVAIAQSVEPDTRSQVIAEGYAIVRFLGRFKSSLGGGVPWDKANVTKLVQDEASIAGISFDVARSALARNFDLDIDAI
jgi:hypothetical protein